MNENEMRNLFEKWVEAWNSQDWESMKPLYAENVVLYQAPVKKTLTGINFVKSRLEDLFQMSSNAQFSIRELTVAGNKAFMEFNAAGTNDGPFLDFEPTGQRFDFDSCLVFEVEDGKITKHTTYVDTATVLRALGLIDIPSARPEAA